MSRRRWCFLVLAVAAAVPVGVYLGREYLLPPMAYWLDVGGPPQRADYVMVLPGDANVRPFVAAALVKAGLAGRVLVPKTETAPEVDDGIYPPSDELIGRVLVRRGVAPEKIVILSGRSNSTCGDARVLAEFLESSPGARVSVVTNNYHTRRARWIFARVLKDRTGQVSFVSAPTEGFRPDNWWRVQEGFLAIVSEYLKLACFGAGT